MAYNVRPAGNLLIRHYEATDAGDTWQVFRAAVHGTASRDYTPEQIQAWAPPTVDEALWQKRRSASHTYVACLAGTVVGFPHPAGSGRHWAPAAACARQPHCETCLRALRVRRRCSPSSRNSRTTAAELQHEHRFEAGRQHWSCRQLSGEADQRTPGSTLGPCANRRERASASTRARHSPSRLSADLRASSAADPDAQG
jgi:hypothetical protein